MSHAHTPPELPEITDEAANTPGWVPKLGVALAALFIAWMVLRHGHAGGAEALEGAAGEAEPSAAP